MQAVAKQKSSSPKVLLFRTRMATPAPIPSEQPVNEGLLKHDPVVHGSKAAIAAAIFTCIAAIFTGGTFYVNWSNRSDHKTQQTREQFNKDVDGLIDAKLNPAVKNIGDILDKKLEPITKKLDDLGDKVSDAQGQLKRLRVTVSGQAEKREQLLALARIHNDPAETLDSIRTEIQIAEQSGEQLPYTKLVDFKMAAKALPVSAMDYWKTVAVIINYQSYIDQLNGQAPDPRKVSRPCRFATAFDNNGNVSIGNVTSGGIVSGCIVDLGVNSFQNVTFKNCVIRYHGGSVALSNVKFTNCRFIFDVPAQPPVGHEQDRLLLTLLNSPRTSDVLISSTH